MEAYQDALMKQLSKTGGLQCASEGTFAWLCHTDFNSTTFKVELEPQPQATRRRRLVNLHSAIGEKTFAKIEAKHVRVWQCDATVVQSGWHVTLL